LWRLLALAWSIAPAMTTSAASNLVAGMTIGEGRGAAHVPTG